MAATCKTCRWWGEQREANAGTCLHKKISFRGVVVDVPLMGQLPPPDGMTAANNDAEVRTGPDFGCIHHEPKESNDEPRTNSWDGKRIRYDRL